MKYESYDDLMSNFILYKLEDKNDYYDDIVNCSFTRYFYGDTWLWVNNTEFYLYVKNMYDLETYEVVEEIKGPDFTTYILGEAFDYIVEINHKTKKIDFYANRYFY
jgi:hypothetical protein